MIKTLYAVGISIFLTTPLFAATGNFSTSDSIILFVAVTALVIAIVNFFRIKRVRQIHEVDFMNQKEDFTLTLERFKTSLSQDHRNPRKEFPRQPNVPKNTANKPVLKPAIKVAAPVTELKTDATVEVKTETPRNPKPKKKYYHRRKPGTSGEKSSSPKD